MRKIHPLFLLVTLLGCHSLKQRTGDVGGNVHQENIDKSRTNIQTNLFPARDLSRVLTALAESSPQDAMGYREDAFWILLGGTAIESRAGKESIVHVTAKEPGKGRLAIPIHLMNTNDITLSDIYLHLTVRGVPRLMGHVNWLDDFGRSDRVYTEIAFMNPTDRNDIDPPMHGGSIGIYNPSPGEYDGTIHVQIRGKRQFVRHFKLVISAPPREEGLISA